MSGVIRGHVRVNPHFMIWHSISGGLQSAISRDNGVDQHNGCL
jgi:hypothetical protein